MTDTTNTPTPETDGLQDAIDFLKANRYRKGFETAATMLYGLLSARERLQAAEAELAALRSAPAPAAVVEALPEGCPETLEFFTRTQSLFVNPEDYDPKNPEPSVVVEIHPVGTRARLSRLERDNNKDEA